VVIGEVELVIDKLLDDLECGAMRGTYKSDMLHSMVGLAIVMKLIVEAARA
jgi:hypothetical protein